MLEDDKRFRIIEETMKQHNYEKSSLLEILHITQELFGYIDKQLLMHISSSLNLPPSLVFGVATFYNFFKLKQPGEHVITACLGTACYVKGVEDIILVIERKFNLKRGGTTADGKLSLFVTRCIGACSSAPNIIVDKEVISKATADTVLKTIKSHLKVVEIENR
ncbi:NAD(P)H-dependent oxidoreductase subunit E [Candidatus Bathyarchaeota archaeon]|nr:NAD(P)H-dependent oxidoreductase subunit E [Candidatus Bathyarchaeota archaeon]